MKDYKEISGLDIKLEDIGLTYDQNIFAVEPKARTYNEAREVYLEKSAEEQELYWMYRYFEATDDADKFEAAQVEYDITVIKNGTVGPEMIKTAGHYHAYVPGTEMTYPEVYEVIDGEIDYLLQTKPDPEGNVDVVVVSAKKGDKVVVPPNFGHISVNVGNEFCVSSNLQKRDLPAGADYESFKVNNGGALYRTANGWENNLNYNVRSLKKVAPREKHEWGLSKDKPLYTSFIENPDNFKFLTEPQNFNFSDVWADKEDF
jgi:glucose-6-phosphate isomerase